MKIPKAINDVIDSFRNFPQFDLKLHKDLSLLLPSSRTPNRAGFFCGVVINA